jgi:hypothetical protein
MKRIVETTEDTGLMALLGERVALWCECYIYAGILRGVNEDCVELAEAHVVYETGPLTDAGFKDAQPLPADVWHVRIDKIESFGAMS